MTGPTGNSATQVDRDAVGRWYSRHADTVFRVVLSRTGDRTLAEDLTADTFVRALAATQSATVPINDPGAWLNTIARNLVRDHYRSSRHRREIPTGDLRDVGDRSASDLGPEQAVIAAETNEELRCAVEQLPPAARECLRLRFWQDLPVADAAAAMGCPVGTVKARQHHAVRRVAQLLPGDSELRPPQRDTTDPLVRAHRAVAEVQQHRADQSQQPGRAQQLARWHTDDQAAERQAPPARPTGAGVDRRRWHAMTRHRATHFGLPGPVVLPPRTPTGPGLSTDPLRGDHAMLQTLTCVTARCDQCGQDCFDDWYYQPRWPTETAALTDLANQGWQVTGRRLVCRGCTAVLACQAHGHEFSSWRDCLCGHSIPAHCTHSAQQDGVCGVQYRYCERCGRSEERPVTGDGQGVA